MKTSSLRPSRWPHAGDLVLWLATGLATLLVLVILVLTFALNASAILVRSRMRRHFSRVHG